MEAYKNLADKLVRPAAPEVDSSFTIEHPGTDPVAYLHVYQSYYHIFGTVQSAYEEYCRKCSLVPTEPVSLREFCMHLHAPYGQFKHWLGERLTREHERFNCFILTKKSIF